MASDDISTIEHVREEMNALVTLLNTSDFANFLRQTLSEFEYQGLNVIGITKEIIRRGMAGDGRTREDVRRDIASMIILFLSRGNNVDKMLMRTNEAGRVRISGLKGRYALVNNVGRGGNTVITLSRVAAVFPIMTMSILGFDNVVIPRAVALSTVEFGENFPKQMRTVIAASVFPKGDLGVKLMRALLLYLIEENKLLSNTAGMGDHDILLRILPFARASYVSSIIPQARRIETCRALGIVIAAPGAVPTIHSDIVVAVSTSTSKFPTPDLSFIE